MRIAFLFYEGMTALDAIGPHEILCRVPGAEMFRVARTSGPVRTDSGVILTAEHPLSAINQADVLLIPGASSATSLYKHPEILNWVRSIHGTTTWTTSVCTGSLILGAAGILKGIRATSHWAAIERLKAWGAEPVNNRVVVDGKVITAAGVSAGIDMALMLAAKIAGPQFAQSMQLGIEYDPEPPFNSGSPAKADPILCKAVKSLMAASFEEV